MADNPKVDSETASKFLGTVAEQNRIGSEVAKGIKDLTELKSEMDIFDAKLKALEDKSKTKST